MTVPQKPQERVPNVRGITDPEAFATTFYGLLWPFSAAIIARDAERRASGTPKPADEADHG